MKNPMLTLVVFAALSPVAVMAQSSVSTTQSATTTAADPMTGQAATTTRTDSHTMNCNGMGDMSQSATHAKTADVVNPDGTVTHQHVKKTHTATVTRTPNGVQETEGTTSQTNTSTNPQ